jgi:hypothetical protein
MSAARAISSEGVKVTSSHLTALIMIKEGSAYANKRINQYKGDNMYYLEI